MIIVEMLSDWEGEPDIRGDRIRFARGWIGEMDDDSAGFCIAIRHARPTKTLPDDVAAGVETLRSIIADFRARRVEPTFRDVYRVVIAAAQAGGIA